MRKKNRTFNDKLIFFLKELFTYLSHPKASKIPIDAASKVL
ncbi:hypothetical protein SAMN04487891_11294 [Flagellimonas taeanensis]|jgi:hypothetical protein|uniref:Uncharacterized protein n=1 Tax=Flagellimonas taeanensis TaxID=1005926 RepID=A0A1M7BVD8_9FLAO|nr:hypothetical protein SAMN04487891_11294 [Allomuricauda taeanensis]SHL59005.1 hypothetical protein SAMN05216293_3838 [Allomuricauda taeanensis]